MRNNKIMERKLLPFTEKDKAFFKDVVFVIEATNFEHVALWQLNEESKHIKSWEDISLGFGTTIGYVGDMPVTVFVFCSKLNGHKVAFYESTSLIVDHDMVRKWIDHYNPNPERHTDAGNFGKCYEYVKK